MPRRGPLPQQHRTFLRQREEEVPPGATLAKGCQLCGGCLSGKGRYSAHRKEPKKFGGNAKRPALGHSINSPRRLGRLSGDRLRRVEGENQRGIQVTSVLLEPFILGCASPRQQRGCTVLISSVPLLIALILAPTVMLGCADPEALRRNASEEIQVNCKPRGCLEPLLIEVIVTETCGNIKNCTASRLNQSCGSIFLVPNGMRE